MIDLKEFGSAIEQIAEEKGISKDKVKEIIEMAIAAAYKKDYGEKGQNIQADFNSAAGTAEFYQVYKVVTPDMVIVEEELEEEDVDAEGEPDSTKSLRDKKQEDVEEEVEDEDGERKERYNPKRHVYLEEAREKNPDIEVGEELKIKLEPRDSFGRIAAQTAKQVIIQRIREAEREATYEEFKEKEGELVSGSVQRIDRGMVYLDIGRTTGVIFPDEQIPGERYRQGQRIRVYVVRVEKETRGPAIVLSRKHPRMIAQLFELEVPEIASGIVEIKGIAREAGSRSKIAVVSHDDSVDPVGACVGQKGIRVSAVINELGGENIDIIPWDEEPERFIANALSPAKVLNVELDEEEGVTTVTVADEQLSLAIGRKGQNVRLAAKLVGWKIDVQGTSGPKDEAPAPKESEESQEEGEEREAAEQTPEEDAESEPAEKTTEEVTGEEVSEEGGEQEEEESGEPDEEGK